MDITLVKVNLLPLLIMLYNSVAQIDTILIDFSEAFDKVPHQGLPAKFTYYGIQGTLLDWIKDFLSKQSQRVILNYASSDSPNVLSGVPRAQYWDPYLSIEHM